MNKWTKAGRSGSIQIPWLHSCKDGKSTAVIKIRLAADMSAMSQENLDEQIQPNWNSTKLVLFILLNGCGSWTLTAEMEKSIQVHIQYLKQMLPQALQNLMDRTENLRNFLDTVTSPNRNTSHFCEEKITEMVLACHSTTSYQTIFFMEPWKVKRQATKCMNLKVEGNKEYELLL